MNVKLKQRKLKNGMLSLYLEYYLGYSTTSEGKIKHKRKKENLDLYIYEKPKNSAERQENREALDFAEKILTKRKSEINENKYEMFSNKKLNTNLIEYFERIKDTKTSSKSLQKHWTFTINHLKRYCKPDITTFRNVDEAFCEGFKDYLLNLEEIHNNTASGYFEVFREGIKKAYKEKMIQDYPMRNSKGIKKTEVKREYLTIDEVKKLALTKCENDKLKRAFIFACLTGLRWSDVYALKWKDIEDFNGQIRLSFRQVKTKGVEHMYLNRQAVELLGDKGNADEKVFAGLQYTTDGYYRLQLWGKEAGINKKLTFHIARHTFATMQLTLGTDLYTVSKLLGHRFIKTTQIYAKIVDEKLKEAVNKIPEIEITK